MGRKKEPKSKYRKFAEVTTVNQDGVYDVPFDGAKPPNPPGLFPEEVITMTTEEDAMKTEEKPAAGMLMTNSDRVL